MFGQVYNYMQRKRFRNCNPHLWPLLRNKVEQVVLEVPLDDDLVVAGDGRAAGELLTEELGRDL